MKADLPYRDTKPVGAASFYFAINATFRFIRQRRGEDGLRRYWHDLGAHYYKPVSTLWQAGGLPAVSRYWREFFAAEPGADVQVCETKEEVRLEVKTCPAIAHLRQAGREIDPGFCQHCYFVSEAIATQAQLTVRITGGGGSCTQRFLADSKIAPQDILQISSCS